MTSSDLLVGAAELGEGFTRSGSAGTWSISDGFGCSAARCSEDLRRREAAAGVALAVPPRCRVAATVDLGKSAASLGARTAAVKDPSGSEGSAVITTHRRATVASARDDAGQPP
jgi:hypothetical protein